MSVTERLKSRNDVTTVLRGYAKLMLSGAPCIHAKALFVSIVKKNEIKEVWYEIALENGGVTFTMDHQNQKNHGTYAKYAVSQTISTRASEIVFTVKGEVVHMTSSNAHSAVFRAVVFAS